MRDLTITRTVEQWVRRRRLQKVIDDSARALLVAVVVGGATIAWVAWMPSWSFLFVPASLVVVGAGLWVGFRQRRPLKPDQVAAEVDAVAQTKGLLRTALAIEGGLASASPAVGNVVRASAVQRLSALEVHGSPRLRLPLRDGLMSLGAALLCLLVVVGAVGVRAMSQASLERPSVPAFDEQRAAELAEVLDQIEELALEPGTEPLARRDLQLAAQHVRDALAKRGDAREAARALDEAHRTLGSLKERPLTSASALHAARPEELAEGIDRALRREDPGAARRLGEEVLRRVDGAATDGELRRLGQAMAEKVKAQTDAGGAARKAGQALQAGERGEALAALADLMASLGEPVRMEPRREALAEASESVEDARQDALRQLESDRAGEDEGGSGERRERTSEAPNQDPDKEGAGTTPSPVDAPMGGEGDGGGGTAKGGTQDAREGGTPGPGGEPEVRVDGERPAGNREEGPSADGGRLVAGEGPSSEGVVDPDLSAGAGEGSALTEGGLPSDDAGDSAPSLVAGAGPAAGEGAGEGMGSGATIDVPLLELDPDTVAKEWVSLQWDGAGEAMGDVLESADAGGRSSMAWGEVHARYGSLAEAATRRGRLPLTRRDYVRRYFEAIRPPPSDPEPQ